MNDSHDDHTLHQLLKSYKIKNPYHIIHDKGYSYCNIQALMKAKTKNKIPVTIVPRCKKRSIPRAFCFPNNCSAPPEIAPDKPSLLPLCNKTSIIIIIELMTNNVFTTVDKFNAPPVT